MGIVFKSNDDVVSFKKFNSRHDPKTGRFTFKNGTGIVTFSGNTNTAAGKKAAEAEKQRQLEAKYKQVAPKGMLKTKVDMNDIAKGEHSLKNHIDKDGNLTPEREQLHKEIIHHFLAGVEKAPEGEQTFYMLGGGSASGKTTIRDNTEVSGMPSSKGNKAVTVDPDAVKALLPEYKQMVKDGNMDAAKFVHEESSALAKRISSVAQQNGYNVVYDGTGDNSPNSVLKKINEAKANGLKTVGLYVTIPIDEAISRSTSRAAHSGRKVPVETIIGTHKGVTKTLPVVAKDFDEVKLIDNQIKGKPRLVATGGSGKGLTAVDEKLFKEFMDKENYTQQMDLF